MTTSDARKAANRRNAALSTGPRTAAGQARSAQNARRHGLSRPTALTGAAAAQAEVLARTLAGGRMELWDAALAYAELDFHLRALRQAREACIEQSMLQSDPERPAAERQQARRDLAIFNNLKPLEVLAGYERRTLSRLRKIGRSLSDVGSRSAATRKPANSQRPEIWSNEANAAASANLAKQTQGDGFGGATRDNAV